MIELIKDKFMLFVAGIVGIYMAVLTMQKNSLQKYKDQRLSADERSKKVITDYNAKKEAEYEAINKQNTNAYLKELEKEASLETQTLEDIQKSYDLAGKKRSKDAKSNFTRVTT